ncbi:MAG: flagellar hook-length control protein FliK [Phycisphaerae bacterium]
MRTQIRAGSSTTTMRLDPPELGMLRLRMELRDETLRLDVDAQSRAAQRLLSEHIDALRDGLAAAGIHLQQVEIRASESNAGSGASTPWQPDTSARQQHRDDEATDGRSGAGSQGGERRDDSARGDRVWTLVADSRVNVVA